MTEKKEPEVKEEPIQWYVVNTYSGHENRVKENLEKRVESMGIQDSLFRIVVAEEPEIEIKGGKQVEKMHNLFPGYLFVEMKMTNEAWYVIRNTPGVTGFIGSSGGGAKPFPVAPEEMESILRRIGKNDKNAAIDFKIGDRVKVLSGPFVGKIGRVIAMNDQTRIASVSIAMFAGREIPSDIEYTDLEKSEK
ncbi:MAG: transcription termination/antitermination factor NusG [Solobacterium sp.]|nr:transcription termination/antitermination factor NusG [Solobacterium sp.]